MIRRLRYLREMHTSHHNDDSIFSDMVAIMSVGMMIIFLLLDWIYVYSVWMMNQ